MWPERPATLGRRKTMTLMSWLRSSQSSWPKLMQNIAATVLERAIWFCSRVLHERVH